MSDGQHDTSATVREWEDIISRARFDNVIPGTKKGRFVKATFVKAVAHAMSRYADKDGTRVFPGVARLAVDCEVGYDIAARVVAGLRDLGLIELVRRAVRRGPRKDRERTDEYRLALPVDLLDRLHVPTPSDYLKLIEHVAKPHRPTDPPRSRTGLETPDLTPAPTGSDRATAGESNPVSDRVRNESNPVLNRDLTPSTAVATIYTDLPLKDTLHPDEDLPSKAAATRVCETEPEDPNFEVAGKSAPPLRVVTGGGKTTPAVAALWPAAVRPDPQRDTVTYSPSVAEQAIARMRRDLADRKRHPKRGRKAA